MFRPMFICRKSLNFRAYQNNNDKITVFSGLARYTFTEFTVTTENDDNNKYLIRTVIIIILLLFPPRSGCTIMMIIIINKRYRPVVAVVTVTE